MVNSFLLSWNKAGIYQFTPSNSKFESVRHLALNLARALARNNTASKSMGHDHHLDHRVDWVKRSETQHFVFVGFRSSTQPTFHALAETMIKAEFFYFLDHFGFTNLFMELEPKSKQRNSPIPFMRIIFIYMMRIVAGLQFFWHTEPVILRSQALMRLVGFNGREIKEGTCNREKKKSSVKKSPFLFLLNPTWMFMTMPCL
jgi:hypothetical protein